MKIINYDTSKRVTVEFLDDTHYKTTSSYGDIKRGNVRNPFQKIVYGVGIPGEKYDLKGKEYNAWINMLKRCYNTPHNSKNQTYFECFICNEWLYYPNFYEWLHKQENFEQWLNDGFSLDKDILVKGNKFYSPERCCLVPMQINELFTKTNAKRGQYPIGVSFHKRDHVYEANCCDPFSEKHQIYLGRYKTEFEAFNAYKNYKGKIIKRSAQEEYNKGNITKKCYDAMMRYEVEITD